MAQANSATRQQLLETAGRLFFREGYRAVGIDTIVAESGVAKMTLYRHFPSKDALIVAYLEQTNEQFWDWFEQAVASAPAEDAKAQIMAVFGALQKMVSSPTCYGCPFLMAGTEFPDPQHSGHQVALANKQALRARFRQLAAQAHLPEPEALGDHLCLLMDGAFMAVRLFGIDNPARNIQTSVAHLLQLA